MQTQLSDNKATDPSRLRCRWLLAALLVLHIASPLLSGKPMGEWALVAGYVLVLLSGVYAVATRRRVAYVATVLVIPFVTCVAIGNRWPATRFELMAGLSGMPFLFYVAWTLLMYALRVATSVEDRLLAAACAFMLLASAWAGLYAGITLVQPDAFAGMDDPGGPRFHELIYLSFMTITTVGYGDVIPITPFARAITMLEAMLGPFYLAVVVARFVGMFSHDRPRIT